MEKATVKELQDRYKELLAEKLIEICGTLNDEFTDDVIYVADNELWVDCSDYSPKDVKIS